MDGRQNGKRREARIVYVTFRAAFWRNKAHKRDVRTASSPQQVLKMGAYAGKRARHGDVAKTSSSLWCNLISAPSAERVYTLEARTRETAERATLYIGYV